MDKVFVSSSSKSGRPTSKLLNWQIGKHKSRESTESKPEYFPRSGGGGVESYEFNPDYMSYEPNETMVDSDVYIPEEKSQQLRRAVRKIIVKGSKYEIVDQVPGEEDPDASVQLHTPPRSPSKTPIRNPKSAAPRMRMPDPNLSQSQSKFTQFVNQPFASAYPDVSQTVNTPHESTPNEEPTWLDTLCDLNFRNVEYFIRRGAQKSVVLLPLDGLADKFSDVPFAVDVIVGVELFALMLMSDFIAALTRVICRPTTFLAESIARYIFKFN